MRTMWAIRHKPTGFMLPNPKGHSGRGGSFVDPQDPKEIHPRLFITQLAAKRALIAWLRGKHKGNYETEYSEWDGEPYSVCIGYVVVAVPSRKAEDMEVVEIELKVKVTSNEAD